MRDLLRLDSPYLIGVPVIVDNVGIDQLWNMAVIERRGDPRYSLVRDFPFRVPSLVGRDRYRQLLQRDRRHLLRQICEDLPASWIGKKFEYVDRSRIREGSLPNVSSLGLLDHEMEIGPFP